MQRDRQIGNKEMIPVSLLNIHVQISLMANSCIDSFRQMLYIASPQHVLRNQNSVQVQYHKYLQLQIVFTTSEPSQNLYSTLSRYALLKKMPKNIPSSC